MIRRPPRATRTDKLFPYTTLFRVSELMRRNLKTLLSTAAVVAALAGGPAVYAYAETPMQNESGSMMQDGQDGMTGQGGMMNMMQQMSQIDRKSTRLNTSP